MIYFIQAGKNGPVKIGCTENVESRLAHLQTANPYELKLLWFEDGNQAHENGLHVAFKHERIRGEWFHPSDKLLMYIYGRYDELDTIRLPFGELEINHSVDHISVSFNETIVTFFDTFVEITNDQHTKRVLR